MFQQCNVLVKWAISNSFVILLLLSCYLSFHLMLSCVLETAFGLCSHSTAVVCHLLIKRFNQKRILLSIVSAFFSSCVSWISVKNTKCLQAPYCCRRKDGLVVMIKILNILNLDCFIIRPTCSFHCSLCSSIPFIISDYGLEKNKLALLLCP